MKVLTAAGGTRDDDVAAAVVGEIVRCAMTCTTDRDGGGCGCGTAFVGLSSRRYCTVARVAELELDLETLVAMVDDSFTAGGWTVPPNVVEDWAIEIIELAEPYPVGTRLRRHLDEVTPE